MKEDNGFCVYLHCDKLGVPFYVGSGRIRRAYDKELSERSGRASKRGDNYKKKVKELNFDYDVLIVKQDLTLDEAIELEILIYDQNIDTIVNHKRPSKIKTLTKELADEWFYYDETSVTFLRWKKDTKHYKAKVGSVAGTTYGGRCNVKLCDINYCIHRVIAVLFNMDIENKVIDHIDGNTLNNNISNLRAVDNAVNSRNRKIQFNSSTGVAGVNLSKSKNAYIAYCHDSGKTVERSFSIRKYGEDEAFRLACDARKQMIERLNVEKNYGYSDRHGT